MQRRRSNLEFLRDSRFGFRIHLRCANFARSGFVDHTRGEAQIVLIGILFDLNDNLQWHSPSTSHDALTLPNPVRFAPSRKSVIPSRSFIFRCLRPPRFFRPASMGGANGLIALTGGGSCNFSSRRSMSPSKALPCWPCGLSWKLSMRAANVTLQATRRAAFTRRSWKKRPLSSDFVIFVCSYLRTILHNFRIEDRAGVRHRCRRGESAEQFLVRSQQENIARRHLG